MYRSPPPPIDVDALPRALRAEMRESVRVGHAVGAKGALERWIEGGGERAAPVLVALAWALHEDAVDMLPDRMLPDGKRALALIAEAVALGFPKARVRVLEAKIRKAVRAEEAAEAEVNALLEREDDLDEEALSRAAYRLSRRGTRADKLRAARLQRRLASIASTPRERTLARCSAAWNLAEAGRRDEAKPDLERIVNGDLSMGDALDANYLELALAHLVEMAIAARDGGELERLYATGLARRTAIGGEGEIVFPYNSMLIETWLAGALDLGLDGLCTKLLRAHDAAKKYWSKGSVDAKLLARARARAAEESTPPRPRKRR